MTHSSPLKDFKKANRLPKPTKEKMWPTSVRFTEAERAYLEKQAGQLSLSAYIRSKVLDGYAENRKSGSSKKSRKPKLDHAKLAQLLAMFGESDLGRSMVALAAAAEIGALVCDEETHDKLHQACDDIKAIRHTLIVALGIKDQK